jgi:hypothetical protein
MLYRINMLADTRKLLHMEEPDLHMKDVEILLRGFAMLVDGQYYRPSMIKFLNQFSRKRKAASEPENEYLEKLFRSFLTACDGLPSDAFLNKGNRRFNIALYEATFTAVCESRFQARELIVNKKVNHDELRALAEDPEFLAASQKATTAGSNVSKRLQRGRDIISRLQE